MRFIVVLVLFILAYFFVLYLTAELRQPINDDVVDSPKVGSSSADASRTFAADEARNTEQQKLTDLISSQIRLISTLEEIPVGTVGAKIAANSNLVQRLYELRQEAQGIDEMTAWLTAKMAKESDDFEIDGHSGYSILSDHLMAKTEAIMEQVRRLTQTAALLTPSKRSLENLLRELDTAAGKNAG
ncbi:MAG: hypothetical protein R3C56_41420 [Pirellulaceae bacterium]